MPASHHHDLCLLNPAFDSPLVDVVTDLEHLRRLRLGGSTPAPVIFQLKSIFHMLESLGSARIEGNHTTLADYVESRLPATAALRGRGHHRRGARTYRAASTSRFGLRCTRHAVAGLRAADPQRLAMDAGQAPWRAGCALRG